MKDDISRGGRPNIYDFDEDVNTISIHEEVCGGMLKKDVLKIYEQVKPKGVYLGKQPYVIITGTNGLMEY